jgi:oxygen-dependent protoporphyrinogen oxidase
MDRPFHVAIVGGGIAGLATAYYFQQLAPAGSATYTLLESGPAWGGKIQTVARDGFVVEGGPDSFIAQKPAGLRLCRELGLAGQLIGTNDEQRKVYVLLGGRLRALPDGVMLVIPTRFTPFALSPMISLPGKLRMGLDLFIPRRRENGDESLADFIRRRLGQEALDRIAEPLMSGIHVSDPERQSIKGTFPRFVELERKHGSLIKGMLAHKALARQRQAGAPTQKTSVFVTLRGGLGQLVEALTKQLNGELRLNAQVAGVQSTAGSYRLHLKDGQTLAADALVLATPSYVAADLLQPLSPAVAARLRAIRYVSTATLSLAYRRDECEHPLNGFGFVVPRREACRVMACTWTSTKFSSRAPHDHVLLRAFVGGPHRPELVDLDDAALLDLVREDLRQVMGIRARPVMTWLYRWPQANPQYDVGHLERMDELEALLANVPGLHLTGSAYRGVGIPDCIEQGKATAEKIKNQMSNVKRNDR